MSEQLRRLNFLGPMVELINDEVNYTIRNGTKWADLSVGDKVQLGVTNGPDIVKATIKEVWVGPFQELPIRILRDEHASDAANVFSIFKTMKGIYTGFDWDSTVVAIGFEFSLNK